MRCLVLLLVGGSLLAAPAVLARPGSSHDRDAARPNIVLIVGDDHGWPYSGFMGNPFVLTPNLDQLADEGAVFTHVFAPAAVCRPALQTLMAGIHPFEWTARREALEADGDIGFRREVRYFEDTLPRLLRKNGYVSFQAGKHWEGTFADAGYDDGEQVLPPRFVAGSYFGRPSIELMEEFLAGVGDAPFFMFLAPMLPHVPFDPSGEFVEPYLALSVEALAELGLQSLTELFYYANVTRLDDVVGRIRSALPANTVILYVSDNGFQAAPVDPGQPWSAGVGGPKGKTSPHELGLRTPLILHGAGERGRHKDLLGFEDVYATVLAIAGVELPEGHRGRDVRKRHHGFHPGHRLGRWGRLPARLRRPVAGGVRSIRWRPGEWNGANPKNSAEDVYWCRSRSWRYIHWADRGEEALFRIEKDPLEERNLLPQHQGVLKWMRRCVDDWEAELAIW